VVLDNAEHLVTEVARVAKTLVAGAPGLHLLVTSQAALNVSSEWLMRLEPLALPPAPMPVPDARTFDAVQLFAQRAQAADHRFELHEQNVEAVIEICRRLDGLPLALELAAARVRLLGATGLAAALHERLKLLGPAYRHAPARQRTLRAALEWSWALLDADHSVVLRRLGVFAGSFSLQMAQAVCADGDLDAWAVVDLLGALVDHSLVMVLAGDVPRYRLLESMRALALERLGEAGEVEAIRRRHAHAMLARFEQMYEDRFAGRIRVDDALAALMPDYDNAVEAARWAVQHDVPTAVALMNPLTVPFRLMGLPELYELWTQTAGLLHTTLKPVCRAGWLMGACTVWRRDKPALAAEHGRQAVELYRRHGPARELYLALDGVAGAERSTDAQEQLWREMMAIERPEWPPAVRSAGAWVRALMRHRGGDPESALRAYEQAAALDAQAGDSARLAAGRANLMDLCLLLGRIDDAVAYGLQLVEQLEKKRQGTLLVFALVNLTAAWLAKDEVAAARAAATRLLALVFQPYFDFRAIFSTYLAEMAALERRSVDAARFIGYSDRIYAETTAREGYEVLAAERARRLAREQLGDAAYEREVRTGGSMSDEVMEQMARQMLAATLQV
jgi:predicted ATPase